MAAYYLFQTGALFISTSLAHSTLCSNTVPYYIQVQWTTATAALGRGQHYPTTRSPSTTPASDQAPHQTTPGEASQRVTPVQGQTVTHQSMPDKQDRHQTTILSTTASDLRIIAISMATMTHSTIIMSFCPHDATHHDRPPKWWWALADRCT